MKNKFVLSFCLMMISSMLSFSQTNYKPGFIIKDKDTIYGEIDYRNDKKLSKICRFKIDDDIKEYAPFEIDGYRFKDDRFFISEQIDQEKVFLEVLIKGKLNVFSFTEILGKPRYFISNDHYPLREVTYPEEDVARAAKNYLARLNQHIALLNVYTSDAPSLNNKINSISQPTRKNLIKLAKTYHNTVCDTEKCIVYESKPEKTTILTELRLGITSYTDEVIHNGRLAKKYVYKTEALVYLSIPNLGDEWYFKTGISFLKQEYYRGIMVKDRMMIDIPLQLQYIRDKNIVRPKLSYGLVALTTLSKENVDSVFSTGILMGAGVNVKVSKKMFVSLNSDFKFSPIGFILPKQMYSMNMSGGLVYQF